MSDVLVSSENLKQRIDAKSESIISLVLTPENRSPSSLLLTPLMWLVKLLLSSSAMVC